MEGKYLKYNLEELIEDKQFVAWVLRGNKNNEWKKFIEDNPGIKLIVKKASEIILLVCDTYEVLDEESVLKIWQNIEHFNQFQTKKIRNLKLRKFLSWAAVILFAVSVGSFSYLYLQKKNSDYQFVSSEIQDQSNESRLILSDGEEIELHNDNSTISLNNNNELIINNDSVIVLSQKESESDNVVQMNEVIIPYGKKSELLLADGTKVWLNAGSRLAFPSKFTKKTREVYLEGEAYFEVVKNEAQPFIVNVAEIDIKVLGTHFNVSAYSSDENILTVLLEGSVSVNKLVAMGFSKNENVLNPYQKAKFDKQNKSIVISDEPNADLYIAWTEGWLQFSHESLHSVFAKLERYYNVEINTPEKFPSSELISGKLDLKESLEDVLVALADVAKIEYRITGNEIYIDKKLNELLMR